MDARAKWGVASVLVLILAASAFWYLNRGYGQTTQQGYAYSIALFTACNQQDESKLQKIASMIESDLDEGKIAQPEARWLNSIINKGLRGNWSAANRDVRKLMKDQVRPAAP